MRKNSIATVVLSLFWSCVSEHVEPMKPTASTGSGGPYVPKGSFVIETMVYGDRLVPESTRNCAIDDTFTIAKKEDGKYWVEIDLGLQQCASIVNKKFLLNESNESGNSGFNFALPPSYELTRFSPSKYGENHYEVDPTGDALVFSVASEDPLGSDFTFRLRRLENDGD